jgi:RNA polymerase sigma factor (sigma-70 family)
MTDPAANPDTIELFARYRQGDQQAATTLFERYLLRLTALVRARLASRLAARVDPEDVIQSAYRSFFIGAHDGRFSIEQSGDLWRLLVTITLRKLYRQAGRHTADVRDVGREQSVSAAEWAQPVIARDPTPDEVVAFAEELESLLSSLPAVSRRIVELRMQGESLEEIAGLVNRSERTVRRALKQIQDDYVKRYGPVVGQADKQSPRRQTIGRRARRVRAAPSTPIERPTVSSADAPLRYADFVLKELIGAGGMGKVYRAVQRGTDQPVALKFLRKQFLSRPHAVAAFIQEARTIASLKHPGIVAVHGLGRTPWGGLFIVMDLTTGGDLSQKKACGPVPVAQAADWIRQAAEALAHAHERGILHCDLKPANLLLAGDGSVCVTDFGLAQRLTGSGRLITGMAGTAAYMAPEQIADCWGPLSFATDVYGLGTVLYHLLAGRPPFTGERAADVLAQVVAQTPPARPSELNPSVPGHVSDLCLQCLSKRAADRPQSMLELMALLP